MNKTINTVLEQNNDDLERRHLEEFKGIARGMEDNEKNIILKAIPSQVLLDELSRRISLLEDRDKSIKQLFRIAEE